MIQIKRKQILLQKLQKRRKKRFLSKVLYFFYTKRTIEHWSIPVTYRHCFEVITRRRARYGWKFRLRKFNPSSVEDLFGEKKSLPLGKFWFDLHWKYFKENKRYSYYISRLYFFFKPMYFMLHNSLYYYAFFFFNSFIFKEVFIRNYIFYKTQYLTEYICRSFFLFETYDFELFDSFVSIYSLEYEYYKNLYMFKQNLIAQSIEFFYFKNNFFKNNFFAHFFKYNVYYLTQNSQTMFWSDFYGIKKNYFVYYKYLTITDLLFADTVFMLSSLKKKTKKLESFQYCEYKYIYKLFYRNLILFMYIK